MASEQSLEGWDNNPVKFSNVKYPLKISFLLSSVVLVVLVKHIIHKIIKTIRKRKMFFEGQEMPQRIILIYSTAHSSSNRVLNLYKILIGMMM